MFIIISRDFVKKIDQPYFNSWSIKNIGLIINHIINKLFTLKGNYTLLPGHGEPTTLDFERKNNPIIEENAYRPVD